MLVSQVMSQNVVYLSPNDTVSRAARLLARHNIGALPICTDSRQLRGVVTDRDIAIRCVAYENPPEETRLRDIMTRGVVTVTPRDDIREAAHLMAEEQIRRLPVVENGCIVGMLSLSDLTRTKGMHNAEISSALAEISLPRKHGKRI